LKVAGLKVEGWNVGTVKRWNVGMFHSTAQGGWNFWQISVIG
jgi:hypothetical protein